MAILVADKVTNLGGVTVNEYLLTNHNPNNLALPYHSLSEVIGVTVHNTDWITVASNTTPAEQYTRATVNGNMNDVRVHYYVDNVCAWQNLPLKLSGWHAADGGGNGNRKTVSIECIMAGDNSDRDKKSEDNCARLAAELLRKYNLGIESLFTHTHWLNVKDGKNGTVDELNVMRNSYKMCPAYILPHWAAFKTKVATYLKSFNQTANASNAVSAKKYELKNSTYGYASASDAIADKNRKNTLQPGSYYVYKEVSGSVNITKTSGVAGSWIKPANTSVVAASAPKKSIAEIAKEVVAGKWGNGTERVTKLTVAGYNPTEVQTEVNKLLNPAKKSVSDIAKEVIAGKWGNGTDRVNKLKSAGYNPTEVQAEVNKLLKK